jgi:protein ImuB
LVTIITVHGGQRIASLNRAARQAGISAGQSLADARALYPALAVQQADPIADAKALNALARAAERYTPWVAIDPDGGLYRGGAGLWLDISGCAHLFGGEDALLDDLLTRCAHAGYQARAGLAGTPGAAWALARLETKETLAAILPPGIRASKRLSPLPLAGLRLEAGIVEGLERMGLRRIGEIYNLPRAPLVKRFGMEITRRLDQALGTQEESLSPRRPVPAYMTRRAFAEPIGRAEDIDAALVHLLDPLCDMLEKAGQGVRRLVFSLYRVDDTVARIVIGVSRPNRDPAHLHRLFREKLTEVDPGFGIEVAVLTAPLTNPLALKQPDISGQQSAKTKPVNELVDVLAGRLGPAAVNRLLPVASHLPERACRTAPVDSAPDKKQDWQKPVRQPPRPLQLLIQPLPIDVMAPVPDGPPVLFRWRRRQHKVSKAEGPERISPEWWHGDGRAPYTPPLSPDIRDYYRVEDDDGARFWVYREGLYRPDRLPAWYLHGFFA